MRTSSSARMRTRSRPASGRCLPPRRCSSRRRAALMIAGTPGGSTHHQHGAARDARFHGWQEREGDRERAALPSPVFPGSDLVRARRVRRSDAQGAHRARSQAARSAALGQPADHHWEYEATRSRPRPIRAATARGSSIERAAIELEGAWVPVAVNVSGQPLAWRSCGSRGSCCRGGYRIIDHSTNASTAATTSSTIRAASGHGHRRP